MLLFLVVLSAFAFASSQVGQTIEIGEEDALGLCLQCLWVRHLGNGYLYLHGWRNIDCAQTVELSGICDLNFIASDPSSGAEGQLQWIFCQAHSPRSDFIKGIHFITPSTCQAFSILIKLPAIIVS